MAANRPENMQVDIVKEVGDAIVVGVASMISGMIAGSTRELPSVVQSLGQALDMRKMPRTRMAKVNEEIAVKAHAAVVKGWYSRLPRKSPAGRDRPKRLHGKLGPALADIYNTAATTDRVISFIDTELLDREAAHWYRINYGASGSGYGEGRQPKRFVMSLNGSTLGQFRDDLPPDPVSWIPKVLFWDRGGSMFPKSTEVEINETGARAARFFDLGHAVIAREAPKAHERLWRTYLEERDGAARARATKAGINMVGDFRFQQTGWTARVRS